jgi:hypothetical protein
MREFKLSLDTTDFGILSNTSKVRNEILSPASKLHNDRKHLQNIT